MNKQLKLYIALLLALVLGAGCSNEPGTPAAKPILTFDPNNSPSAQSDRLDPLNEAAVKFLSVIKEAYKDVSTSDVKVLAEKLNLKVADEQEKKAMLFDIVVRHIEIIYATIRVVSSNQSEDALKKRLEKLVKNFRSKQLSYVEEYGVKQDWVDIMTENYKAIVNIAFANSRAVVNK